MLWQHNLHAPQIIARRQYRSVKIMELVSWVRHANRVANAIPDFQEPFVKLRRKLWPRMLQIM